MKKEKFTNEQIDEMLRNMGKGTSPVNFEFAGERETKKEERKVINIMLMRKLVPIAAAFVFVIAATVVGVKFLGKDTPIVDPTGTDASVVVTDAPTEDTTKAPVKGSNDKWEYLEYEASVTLTRYMAGNSGDEITLVIPDEINDKPVTDIAEEMFMALCEKRVTIRAWNISEDNKYFSLVDGVLFNKDKTVLISFDKTDESYVVPDGVKRIGAYAFGGKYLSLKNIVLPDSLKSIGKYAFWGCHIENIVIPEGVTYIDASAFYYCLSFTITIPASVETIADDVFDGYPGLINLSLNNKNYKMVDGVLFNSDMTTLLCYTMSAPEEYIIPNTVTNVYNGAFSNTKLKSLTIPGNITKVENMIFADLNDGMGCLEIEKVVMLDGVTTIGDSAFGGCEKLTSITIPDSVTTIEDSAFGYCRNLTSVTIPNSVTTIGNYAFCECENLESIILPDKITAISDGAFSDCSSLKNIVIPDGVTTIGKIAFSGCDSLESITIPGRVTAIADFAFLSCDNLQTIYGEPGSYAEMYAKENGITFVAQ